MWEVEYTNEFEEWWGELTDGEQEMIDRFVRVLERQGPALGRPAVDSVHQSRHPNMKELRPGTIRVLFAFDPRRTAILLIGGDKTGRGNEWYDEMVPVADRLYSVHLDEIREEGLGDG